MVFTLGTLFEAGLLLINAVAILNEEKFLKRGEDTCDAFLLGIFLMEHTFNKQTLQLVGDVTLGMKALEIKEGSNINLYR